jgi:uncharacterized protein (TIGR00369 family)
VSRSPLAALETLTEHLAASPVEGGLGLVPLEVRPGYLRARIPVGSSGIREDGRVSPLLLAVAADCGLGVSVHSSVPGSAGGPTVEMRLDLAGSPAPSTRELQVEGRALDVGPVSGSGRVEIRDGSGSLVATAVGLMSIDRPIGDVPGRDGADPDDRVHPAAVVVRAESPDAAVSGAVLSDGMKNNLGTVHGGVLAALADAAQEAFRNRHGTTRPLSLTVEYLRPAHVEERLLSCHSSFARRGRRFWTVRTEIRRPDGTPVVQATGTSLVVPA